MNPLTFAVLCLFVLSLSVMVSAQTCVDLGPGNLTYSQNFDGFGTSPSPQNNDASNIFVLNASAPRRYLGKFDNAVADNSGSVNVPGWAIVEEGTNASSVTGRYNVGDGSASGGNTYSFGTNSDRAMGSLNEDTVSTTYIGGCFRNNTGSALTHVLIAYTGEMWRRGASGTQTDRLDFEYAVNATDLYNGSYSAFDPLDFATPNTSGAAGARDGNSAAYRTIFSATSMSVNLPAGARLYLRWVDNNIAGADDGLAIDDFTVSFVSASAAEIEVGGRVFDAYGRGVAKAILSLTGDDGSVRYAITNSFGYYRFREVTGGMDYVLTVSAKNRRFETPSVLIGPKSDLSDVNFFAAP